MQTGTAGLYSRRPPPGFAGEDDSESGVCGVLGHPGYLCAGARKHIPLRRHLQLPIQCASVSAGTSTGSCSAGRGDAAVPQRHMVPGSPRASSDFMALLACQVKQPESGANNQPQRCKCAPHQRRLHSPDQLHLPPCSLPHPHHRYRASPPSLYLSDLGSWRLRDPAPH